MTGFVYRPPTEPFLEILYHDDCLMVVDKPSGLLSVPGRLPENQDSILSRIRLMHPQAQAVHRLDMDTSGLLAVPLIKDAVRNLTAQFEKRQVRKTYLALVRGIIKEDGRIDLPIRCDLEHRPLQIVDFTRGRPSVTLYHPLKVLNNNTLLELTPLTGRSHQLRLHLATIGHPILGDRFYGGAEAENEGGLRLNARALSFIHPLRLWPMSFESSRCVI